MNKPRAFLSYVRKDDKYALLSTFRERLSEEIRLQTGEDFSIFQDWKDIGWGQNWRKRIAESLDDAVFFIPILTPAYFNSGACREELTLFLEREKKLERDDLILAVYYVDCPVLNDAAKRAKDQLAELIASRNYVDWRELRFEPFTSPQIGKLLARMGRQVRDALEALGPVEVPVASVPPAAPEPRSVTAEGSAEPKGPREQPVATARELGLAERGPTAKKEVKTRIVDVGGDGQYTTISGAIRNADAGDRIVVRPGVYEEGLVMDKVLEIVGEGELGEVQVRASGKNALSFQATLGRVVNLSLRQMGGGKWFGADIAQGRLELEGCDISSESSACVAIHGSADPRLRRNRIHEAKQGSGVIVFENGQGTVEDNDIFGHRFSGVQIYDRGDPTLRHNRIRDGKQSGIFVSGSGRGTIEENEIIGNEFAGVTVEDGTPTVRRNTIKASGLAAISVYGNGGGIFEDNDLRDNKLGAWLISEDSIANVNREGNIE